MYTLSVNCFNYIARSVSDFANRVKLLTHTEVTTRAGVFSMRRFRSKLDGLGQAIARVKRYSNRMYL